MVGSRDEILNCRAWIPRKFVVLGDWQDRDLFCVFFLCFIWCVLCVYYFMSFCVFIILCVFVCLLFYVLCVFMCVFYLVWCVGFCVFYLMCMCFFVSSIITYHVCVFYLMSMCFCVCFIWCVVCVYILCIFVYLLYYASFCVSDKLFSERTKR